VAAEPAFKPPTLTGVAQRKAEEMADRVDAWKVARKLLDDDENEWNAEPFDVLQLASFLAGETYV
jgi:hypothetical protein